MHPLVNSHPSTNTGDIELSKHPSASALISTSGDMDQVATLPISIPEEKEEDAESGKDTNPPVEKVGLTSVRPLLTSCSLASDN